MEPMLAWIHCHPASASGVLGLQAQRVKRTHGQTLEEIVTVKPS
jgi:hypothetical protein